MRRYPAYDPPEYAGFRPDPEVMAEYIDVLRRDPRRRTLLERLEPAVLVRLYAGLVRFRLHDIVLKRWVRQGLISKAWLGTGEEAVTVGAVHALTKGDVAGPMIRNAGAHCEMGMPVADMLRAYLGTADQISRGRDLHTGDPALGLIPSTSMMGCLVPVFTGIGLAMQQRRERRVGLTWVGDGASRTGAFHEGLNFAAVLKVPIVFVVQNNQVALGTAVEKHSRGPMEALRPGYGLDGLSCEGNNVLDVYAATRLLADRCRKGGGPFLLNARTFRMGGHATHDEAEARALFTPEQFRYWGMRDPIGTYETYLIAEGPSLDGRRRGETGRREANAALLSQTESRVTEEVEKAEQEALRSRRDRMPEPADAAHGVYAGDAAGGSGGAPRVARTRSVRATRAAGVRRVS